MAIVELLSRHLPGEPLPLKRAQNPKIAGVIEENVRTVVEMRRKVQDAKTHQDRIADAITRFSGSMPFVFLHVVWFGAWIAGNVGEAPLLGFDPYPFGLLTMIVSLEAIFLSTFVLISQNKMGEVSARRADLDLQINLLSEYEVPRLLRLVDAMAKKMGVDEANDPELERLEARTGAQQVLDELAAREEEAKVT